MPRPLATIAAAVLDNSALSMRWISRIVGFDCALADRKRKLLPLPRTSTMAIIAKHGLVPLAPLAAAHRHDGARADRRGIRGWLRDAARSACRGAGRGGGGR